MKTLALFIAPLALVTLAFGQQMPDSPGRDLTDKVCSACHGTDNFSRNLVSKDDWEGIVEDMVSRGADANDAQIKQISDYLGFVFGKPVNLNKATEKDIQDELKLSAADAAAIVKARPIKDAATLAKVAGVDQKKIEIVKARLKF